MLVWHESAETGTDLFLFQDHLGSTRVTATEGGTVEDSVSYYPYGGVIPYSSTLSDNHYGFTGYESDGDSDYATFRNLDTNLGRFNRPDPYDGSYRLYWRQIFECPTQCWCQLHMGASRLRRDCLRQRGMPGCGHP